MQSKNETRSKLAGDFNQAQLGLLKHIPHSLDNSILLFDYCASRSNEPRSMGATLDLFSSKESISQLEKLDNSATLNRYLDDQLESFDQFLYLNSCMSNIVKILLEKIYLDPQLKPYLEVDISSCEAINKSAVFKIVSALMKNRFQDRKSVV